MIEIVDRDKFVMVANRYLREKANKHGFNLRDLITEEDKEKNLNYISELDFKNDNLNSYRNFARYLKSLLDNKIQLALKSK